MGDIVGVVIFFGIIFCFFAFFAGCAVGKSRLAKLDNQGEALVRRNFSSHFDGAEYHLLNNVTLPIDNGTTQIDHILISTKGIFIVETKHYSGLILGNEKSARWMQAFHRRKYYFQNPIRQNYKHVKTVQGILEFIPAEHIYSVVIFTGDAEFKFAKPQGVFNVNSARAYIQNFEDDVMSVNRFQFCIGRLECLRKQISGKTDVEHVAHLQRKFGEL